MRTALLAALLLSGCAAFTTAKTTAETEGAAVADQVRDVAEFTLCKGITVGAWVRAYGASADRAAAWKALCAPALTETPAPATKP